MSMQPPAMEALGLLGQDSPDTVRCMACDLVIDAVSGQPLEDAGPDNVAALQEYISEAGQTERGGVALLDLE